MQIPFGIVHYGFEYNECMWSLGDECNYQSSIDVNFSSICEKMLKWIYCTFGESAEEVLNNHDFGSLYSACVEKYRTMIFPGITDDSFRTFKHGFAEMVSCH